MEKDTSLRRVFFNCQGNPVRTFLLRLRSNRVSAGMNWLHSYHFPSERGRWYAIGMRIRSLNHSSYQHQYHIVWGTKYRRKFLKSYVKPELETILRHAMKKYPELHMIAINTDHDHLHMQIEIPPDITVSAVVQQLKSLASAHLKKKYKFIKNMYLDGSIWSVGYFSSTIGLNEQQIRKYIEYQGKEDLPKPAGFEFS